MGDETIRNLKGFFLKSQGSAYFCSEEEGVIGMGHRKSRESALIGDSSDRYYYFIIKETEA